MANVKQDDQHNDLITESLEGFTLSLIEDLKSLRAGEITNSDARVRAQLAREILRGVHLQLEGMRLFSETAKKLPNPVPSK